MARLNAEDAALRSTRKLAGDVSGAEFSEALARGLTLLNAFNGERPRMTLADAARAVNLPRATVRRSLLTLVHLGYLRQDGRTFELTPRVLELATSYLTANPVSAVLQPACDQLCERLGQVCSAAVLDGPDAVMISRAMPQQLLGIGPGIGFRVPAAHSSVGRVLLAALDERGIMTVLSRTSSSPLGPKATAGAAELRERIGRVAEQGFAFVDREAQPGFHSVAVPLRRWDGQVVAALHIGAFASQVNKATMLGPFLDELRATASELSGRLV
jgi:IclR family pca regulon transcriptional regulator